MRLCAAENLDPDNTNPTIPDGVGTCEGAGSNDRGNKPGNTESVHQGVGRSEAFRSGDRFEEMG
jgi:hypothetical protein